MKQYTILHTIESGGPGGAETVVLNLVKRLNPERFRSIVLLPPGPWLNQRLRESGVPHMQDSKLIYFNQRQANDPTGRQIRVLDPDIRVLPHAVRAAHVDEQFDLAGVQRSIMRQYMQWERDNKPVVMPSHYDRPSLQL